MTVYTPGLSAVLELPLAGLPNEFRTSNIHDRAHGYMRELASLIDSKTVLLNTTLSWTLRYPVAADRCKELVLLIGLQLTNQLMLDFSLDVLNHNDVKTFLLNDRMAFVKACREAPLRHGQSASGFALRVAAACRDQSLPELKSEIAQSIHRYLGGRLRKVQGKLVDSDWELDLPHVPLYDWENKTVIIRARIEREKCGYTLLLLRPKALPSALVTLKQLRMPEAPSNLLDVLELDSAAYTGKSLNLEIRIGLDPVSGKPKAADFIRFGALEC